MRRTFVSELNAALDRLLTLSQDVVLLGEDIADPYGGAFKVTRGLSTKHPGRLVNTPISEAGVVGVATGMALRGLRPVVEIMFCDFLGLAMDQLINHACKFGSMYGRKLPVPLTIRTPMGGGRGYGPTHSQCLEKYFTGMPGLKVVAPNLLHDVEKLMEHMVLGEDGPVLCIESKSLYPIPPFDVKMGRYKHYSIRESEGVYPMHTISPAAFDPPDVTVAVYGSMILPALEAATQLLVERELVMEVVVFSELLPESLAPLFESLSRSRRLLTVEEGTSELGWGAELMALVIEGKHPCRTMGRVAATDGCIPSAIPLERQVLPGMDEIVQKVEDLCQ